MKRVKKFSIIGFITVSILGTLSHFGYNFFDRNFIAGLFFPVNESTWEHMKLCFFPMLLYGIIGRQKKVIRGTRIWEYGFGTLYGTWLIPFLYYTYMGILGFSKTFLDICVFFIAVLGAFLWFYIHVKNSFKEDIYNTQNILLTRIVLIAICIQAICFFTFSYYPPKIGLFVSP